MFFQVVTCVFKITDFGDLLGVVLGLFWAVLGLSCAVMHFLRARFGCLGHFSRPLGPFFGYLGHLLGTCWKPAGIHSPNIKNLVISYININTNNDREAIGGLIIGGP